ncbi:MAG: hypothetical protein KDD70_01385 [Bdellovibrionales bacterium]|nr:hypothetical protein [Bdellovibrionales bacterium]
MNTNPAEHQPAKTEVAGDGPDEMPLALPSVPEITSTKYEPLRPGDARESFTLSVTSSQELPAVNEVRHYRLQHLDRSGVPVGKPRYLSTEFRPQIDTVDCAFFRVSERDGELILEMASVEKVRHGPLVRGEVGLPPMLLKNGATPDAKHFRGSPGAYLSHEAGQFDFETTVDDMAETFGLKRTTRPLESVGGPVFPFLKVSAEAAYPFAVEVSNDATGSWVRYGEKFDARIAVRFDDVRDIASGFGQEFPDVREYVLANRLARSKGVAIRPLVSLEEGVSEQPFPQQLEEHLLTKEALDNLLSKGKEALDELSTHARIERVQDSEIGEQGKLTVSRFHATSERGDYDFEVLVGEDVDATQVILFCECGGERYQVVSVGEQYALQERADARRAILDTPKPLQIEGVHGLRNGAITQEEILDRAIAIAKERGFVLKSAPQLLGTGTYSPGFNPGVHDFVAIEIDLEASKEAFARKSEGYKTSLMKNADICASADAGNIRHLPLVAASFMLGGAIPENGREASILAGRREVREAFVRDVVTNGPAAQDPARWIWEQDPATYLRYMQDPTVRKLHYACINSVGLVRIPFVGNQFREHICVYGPAEKSDSRQDVGSLTHDEFHQFNGGFLPIVVSEDGTINWRSREFYVETTSATERLASRHSDLATPYRIGVNEVAAHTWRGKIAEVFHSLGWDLERASRELDDIEDKFVIPKEMLEHPDYEERFRPFVVGKLIRFGLLDRIQAGMIYDDMVEHPRVTAASLRLSNATNDPDDYLRRFQTAEERIAEQPDGINGFQRMLSVTRVLDVELVGLRIAHFMELLEKRDDERSQNAFEQSEKHLEALFRASDWIRSAVSRVETVAPTRENLRMHKRFEEIRKGPIAQARQFLSDLLEDHHLFRRATLQEMNASPFPFFRDISVTAEHKATVERDMRKFERASYDRVGLSYPERFEEEREFPF